MILTSNETVQKKLRKKKRVLTEGKMLLKRKFLQLTESRGNKAVRLPAKCSRAIRGGRVASTVTIAIFAGSPDTTIGYYFI